MKFWENDLNKILLFLLVVLVIFLGFVVYGAYQLRPKNTSWQENSEKQQSENAITQVDTNRCRQITQLRLENVQLKKQLESMKNKIEDEKKAVDDLKGEIAFWFSFGSILVTAITMIVAIIAIVVPLYNEREFKEKQRQFEKKQKEFKAKFEKQNKRIDKNMKLLDENTRAFVLFMLAYQNINDGEKSLFYYSLIINKFQSFSSIGEVYYLRGYIYYNKSKYEDAVEDFENAKNKKNDDYKLFSICADCYRKLAENEQDTEKKAEYETKAEEDEKKAEELKQKGK